jgi:hypothetical protein
VDLNLGARVHFQNQAAWAHTFVARVTSWLGARRRGAKKLLNYDPLEALYQATPNPKLDSVGGSIQVTKVYRNMRVEQFAVHSDGTTSISGRPKLGYENIDLRVIVRRPDGTWSIEPATAISDTAEQPKT